jgi:hypothetical protein
MQAGGVGVPAQRLAPALRSAADALVDAGGGRREEQVGLAVGLDAEQRRVRPVGLARGEDRGERCGPVRWWSG